MNQDLENCIMVGITLSSPIAAAVILILYLLDMTLPLSKSLALWFLLFIIFFMLCFVAIVNEKTGG